MIPRGLAPSPAIESLLSDLVTQALGVTVRIAMADAPLPENDLEPADRDRLLRFTTPARRDEFRRGRAALQRALRAAGRRPGTSGARAGGVVSITHSGELAAAVALVASTLPVAGVGVDLERDRPVKPSMARLFLAPSERTYLATVPADEREAALLRLWTVKEALFKADPDNEGAALHEYIVAEPGRRTGRAARLGRRARFTYVSVRLPESTLSVAVHHDDHREDRHAVTLAG